MFGTKTHPNLKMVLLLSTMLFLLYFFICSLLLLTLSFSLLCSNLSGSILTHANLHNPILGLMMGVFATAIIQSSSATTSLVVAMAASGVITLKEGIPVIMGTNVGTSLTSTMVSLSNIKKADEYELGFSVAVVHDIFNWLTILFMLPLEIGTGLLEKISGQIVKSANVHQKGSLSGSKFSFRFLFDPIISRIVVLKDESLVSSMRVNKTFTINSYKVKSFDDDLKDISDESGEDFSDESETSIESGEDYSNESDISFDSQEDSNNLSKIGLESGETLPFSILQTDCADGCKYLFAGSGLSDEAIGAILMVSSFLIFILCYVFLVRTMKNMLSIPLAGITTKFFSKDLPMLPYLMGYVFILIGALVTVFVQSSSILTSALVPLVSTKIISLERAYPITLGANLGTTTTSILAAFSYMDENAYRLALCHLFFNLFGIAAFYPITFMRWPLFIARSFGRKVIKYKWFSIFYLILSFFLGPLVIFGLSLLNTILMYTIVVTFVSCLVCVILINFLQEHKPQLLPYILKDWKFLPKPLRSFRTIDFIVQTYMEVYCCCIVHRTVAAIPVIGGYNTNKGKTLFGLELSMSKEMQMVKIEKNKKKESNELA